MEWMGDRATEFALKASERTGEEYRTDAVGEGLAAIAFALLEVAEAIRDSAPQQ
ncbi:hypothetical protein [Streptomyces sp. CBMA152]|uniref:hypothetical protein n=1 Tax=Streptomyces sp. CBMA152 TaxID=1896312 RepID=UPI001660E4E9|nr:hypothetical protein [Streptomyces sp. CBMA152]